MNVLRLLWSRFVLFERGLTPLQICIVYVVLGSAWILFSDRALLALVPEPSLWARLSTYKGFFFILISAGLLYGLIGRLTYQLRQSEVSLAERVRQLSCLYEISNAAQVPNRSLDETLTQIADHLPTAFPKPKQVCARITVDGREYGNTASADCHWRQSAGVTVRTQARGTVEIGGADEPTSLHPQARQHVDRGLIEAVAREIASVVERHDVRLSERRLHEQLAHADRLASIGMMAASIAHEVNNPLTTMKALIHALRDERPTDDPRRNDYTIVLDEIDKLKTLILRFMQFARPGQLRLAPMNLADTLGRIADLIGPQAQTKNLTIERRFDPGCGQVRADGTQIGQVILNILLNAIDETPDDGTIRLTADAPGRDTVRVSIWNSGVALPADLREQIFEPFFTTKAAGTGLGLSIARIIVEKHGGHIRAEGHASGGTSFYITLPKSPGESIDADNSGR
jgi:signal transduction histidine kinase